MNHIDPESLTKISGPASRIEHFLPFPSPVHSVLAMWLPFHSSKIEYRGRGGWRWALNLRNFPPGP